MEIHLLVLGRAPKPFDGDSVAPADLAVHAGLNAVVVEQVGEGRARELRVLISVERGVAAVTRQRFLDGAPFPLNRSSLGLG